MDRYIHEYIIPHLEEFGNVFVAQKRIKRLGIDKLTTRLTELGYECRVKQYSHTETSHGWKRTYIDTILTWKEREI